MADLGVAHRAANVAWGVVQFCRHRESTRHAAVAAPPSLKSAGIVLQVGVIAERWQRQSRESSGRGAEAEPPRKANTRKVPCRGSSRKLPVAS